MSVRMRHNRSQTKQRRSHGHGKLKDLNLIKCENCGRLRQNHRACIKCGVYKGKKVI